MQDLEIVVVDGGDGGHLALRVQKGHMGQVQAAQGHLQQMGVISGWHAAIPPCIHSRDIAGPGCSRASVGRNNRSMKCSDTTIASIQRHRQPEPRRARQQPAGPKCVET